MSAVFSAQTNLTCAPGSTGSFTVTGTGGATPYNFRFGTGIYQPNGTFTGLAAGTYLVSVRDANSCTKDTSITIVQAPNTVIASIASQVNIPCSAEQGLYHFREWRAPGHMNRIGSNAFQRVTCFRLAAGVIQPV